MSGNEYELSKRITEANARLKAQSMGLKIERDEERVVMKQRENLMTSNYPTPDPAWDYASTWQQVQESKAQVESFLEYLAAIEAATDETDKEVSARLSEIIKKLQSAYNFVPMGK